MNWSRTFTIGGRRWTVMLRERAAARRAMSWCGVGPARGHSTGTVDVTKLPIAGIAVHVGPWLLIVLQEPPPHPRIPGPLATLRDIERIPDDGL